MWQVKCNDGGRHNFGPSDVPEEAICSVCHMSVGEVEKRKMSNRVIRSLNTDPYTKYTRDGLRVKLTSALRTLDKLDKVDP